MSDDYHGCDNEPHGWFDGETVDFEDLKSSLHVETGGDVPQDMIRVSVHTAEQVQVDVDSGRVEDDHSEAFAYFSAKNAMELAHSLQRAAWTISLCRAARVFKERSAWRQGRRGVWSRIKGPYLLQATSNSTWSVSYDPKTVATVTDLDDLVLCKGTVFLTRPPKMSVGQMLELAKEAAEEYVDSLHGVGREAEEQRG